MKLQKINHIAFAILVAISILVPAQITHAVFSGVLPVASLGTTPDPVVITMSDYTLEAGQTATVTFTFPLVPATFTTGDITAPNGTISNLAITGDPKIYTATYTAASITDATNTISVNPRVSITQYAVGGGTDISFDGTNMWVTNSNFWNGFSR
jgi:hypothetical protein